MKTLTIFSLALFTLVFHAPAQSTAFTYVTNADNTLMVSGYTGVSGPVTIPTSVNGMTVVGIQAHAFDGNYSLTDVTVPGTVTNIQSWVFFEDGLTNIVFENGITYLTNDIIVADFNLVNVVFPPSLTNFGNNVCIQNPRLQHATIPDGTQNIAGLFAYCGLTNVIIPASVTNMSSAFVNCSLTSVIIPSNVVNIAGAFQGCPLASIIIPSNVVKISGAFEYCGLLTNVIFEGAISDLGANTFYNCTNLSNLNFPVGLQNIGSQAFSSTRLTNVIIPASVTNLGSYAFTACTSLTNLSILGTCNIGTNVCNEFDANNNYSVLPLQSVYIAGGAIGPGAFGYCPKLTSVTFGSNITSIGYQAFLGSAVQSLAIPGTCTNIGGFAFESDPITNLTLGNGILSIGSYAFYGLDITSLVIPPSLTNLTDNVFRACPITNLVVPSSLTVYNESVFEDMNVTYFTIPATVTGIGNYNFGGNPNFKGAFFAGNAPFIGGLAFYNTAAVLYYLPGKTGWTNSTINGFQTVLWNPVLQTNDGHFGVQGNHFGFNVTGPTNLPVAVEVCTNLLNPIWTTVAEVTLTNGSYYDSEPLQNAPRFYGLGFPK